MNPLSVLVKLEAKKNQVKKEAIENQIGTITFSPLQEGRVGEDMRGTRFSIRHYQSFDKQYSLNFEVFRFNIDKWLWEHYYSQRLDEAHTYEEAVSRMQKRREIS